MGIVSRAKSTQRKAALVSAGRERQSKVVEIISPVSCVLSLFPSSLGNLYGMGDFDLNDALSPKRLIPTQVQAPKVPSDDNSGHDDFAY